MTNRCYERLPVVHTLAEQFGHEALETLMFGPLDASTSAGYDVPFFACIWSWFGLLLDF